MQQAPIKTETLSDLLDPFVAFELCTAEQAAAIWTRRAEAMGSSRVYTYRAVHDAVRRGSLPVALELYTHHPLFRVRDVLDARLVPSAGHPRADRERLSERVDRRLAEVEERISDLRRMQASSPPGAAEVLEGQIARQERIALLLARYATVIAERTSGLKRARLREELVALGVSLEEGA